MELWLGVAPAVLIAMRSICTFLYFTFLPMPSRSATAMALSPDVYSSITCLRALTPLWQELFCSVAFFSADTDRRKFLRESGIQVWAKAPMLAT